MSDIKINCLVLDDEQHAVDILTEHINDTPYLNLVKGTTSYKEALAVLNTEPVEAVFLDVQMPGINGIEFIQLLSSNYHIVLCSAYPQYAVDGFENDVADFLSKPVTYARFLKSIQKILQSIKAASAIKITEVDTDTYMFVKNGIKGKVLKVTFNELDYVEVKKNYVCFNQQGGQVMTYMTITDAEEKLPVKNFLRIHRSFIVNLNSIVAIEGNSVVIKNRENRVPIGESYKESLLEFLKIK
jgi:two-component system, LytTR family, response regulator